MTAQIEMDILKIETRSCSFNNTMYHLQYSTEMYNKEQYITVQNIGVQCRTLVDQYITVSTVIYNIELNVTVQYSTLRTHSTVTNSVE